MAKKKYIVEMSPTLAKALKESGVDVKDRVRLTNNGKIFKDEVLIGTWNKDGMNYVAEPVSLEMDFLHAHTISDLKSQIERYW